MHKTSWRRKFSIRLVCIFLSLSMLASCATSGMSLRQYNDSTDVCNVSRQTLIETETDLKKWTFGGAAVGAAAGAGIAAAGKGDTKDILLGAIIGTIIGATTGYLAGRRKAAKNKSELLTAIDNDALSDSKRVNQIKEAIDTLGECRQLQIESVHRRFKAGTLTRNEALAKAESIQSSIDKDNELITRVLGRVDKRYNTYVDAKAEVLDVEPRQVATKQASTDPIGSLAEQTRDAKEVQQSQQEQTKHDLEALRILLS